MSTEVNANVIKRNGVEVIFDKAKIINAVEKANEEVPSFTGCVITRSQRLLI